MVSKRKESETEQETLGMKNSRLQFEYRENASSGHKKIGDLLRSAYPFNKVYQEYPVSRINPDCKNTKYHFDWVILDLCIVIEVHGQAHYFPVQFGGISEDQASEAYMDTVFRDKQKEAFARQAGYSYVVIPYTELKDISQEKLISFIRSACTTEPLLSKPVNQTKKLAKQRRKEQYRQQKERLEKAKLKVN